ncbi:MAG: VCBS repeat-containing protein, partial [Candidatus Altiarchaeota archaeon]
ADLNGDGSQEILVGLQNDTILVLTSQGKLNSSFTLGNMSNIGKIYALESADFNDDGKSEIVVGLGGLRVSETFQLYGFEVLNTSSSSEIQWKEKVLYKTVRYFGSIYYLDSNGKLLWKKPTYNSVLSLYVKDVNGDGLSDILTGVGDFGIDIYSEDATVHYINLSCDSEDVEDELTGYDKEKCTCSGCRWEPDEELCLRSYIQQTCTNITTSLPGKVLVEYPLKNGTVYLNDRSGNLIFSKDISTYMENAPVNETPDNNVRVVYSADVNLDKSNDIFAGTDNGFLYVYNISGDLLLKYTPTSELVGGITAVRVSSFNETQERFVIIGTDNGILAFFNVRNKDPLWIARLGKAVESIEVSDIDSDGVQEVLVGCGDNNMYVYDSTGILEWYYPTKSSIYYLKPVDIDGNGYMDVLIGSLRNVTLYEMNVDYVLRQSAGFIYDKAEQYFSSGDYTLSMIYVTRAKDIYFDIKDYEGVTKCDLLMRRVNDELKSRKKIEADGEYERALTAYGRNDINTSLVLLQGARRIYSEINDEIGVKRCDSLKIEIENFIISEKSISAEAHYVKALNYFSFKKYTEALEEARLSRDIYAEIDYHNGTVLANKVIVGLADAYYTDSQFYLSLENFNLSLEYASMAVQLYNETKNYDGTAKSELLLQQIKKRILEGPAVSDKIDYSLLIYVIVGVLVILVIIKIMKRRIRGTEFKSPDVDGTKI